MTPHVLDRPIWHALRSLQSNHAEGSALAVRYEQDIAPFAAAANDSSEALQELADLTSTHTNVVLLQASHSEIPPGTIAEATFAGVQLVAKTISKSILTDNIVELGDEDAPAMQALATLTKPGPFLKRTHLLGQFLGIKHDGQLVAMAGERMKLTGYTEVSGVCTHPDYRGNGYGRLLSQAVSQQIARRGETPFLHAFASNTNAIQLYESIGFVRRSDMSVMVLRRA